MKLDDLLEKSHLPRSAVIRENECIGCTKCIQACPVDAIIGASKQMHTVLADVCIGCELCVPPCPVDCIDILPRPAEFQKSPAFIEQTRSRWHQRQARLSRERQTPVECPPLPERQSAIQEAVLRSQQKRCQK
jgi:H+/Na+-translocating ferredoxin:NAD+ oxidoreductase subunit B